MSALAEIQTMIEERVSAEPHLAGTFHDLYQRVVELKATEQQLQRDHERLQQSYQDLFLQFSSQTGELARVKQQLRDGAALVERLKFDSYLVKHA